MAHDVVVTSEVSKKKRDALKTKRDSLFKEYTKRPNDHHLALEIKKIDDEIADRIQQEQKSLERPTVRRQQTLINS
jgi:hypothetical protein